MASCSCALFYEGKSSLGLTATDTRWKTCSASAAVALALCACSRLYKCVFYRSAQVMDAVVKHTVYVMRACYLCCLCYTNEESASRMPYATRPSRTEVICLRVLLPSPAVHEFAAESNCCCAVIYDNGTEMHCSTRKPASYIFMFPHESDRTKLPFHHHHL